MKFLKMNRFKYRISVRLPALLLSALLLPVTSFATEMKTELSKNKFEETTLLDSAALVSDGISTPLKPVSYGIRKKSLFLGLVAVSVYTLELLAADPTKIDKSEDGALKSLKAAGPILLRITFMRDLEGSKISSGFKDGLTANGITKLSEGLEKLMSEISAISKFKKGESFLISVDWKDEKSTISLLQNDPTNKNGQIKSIIGDLKMNEEVLSIWFGNPADNELHNLKKALLK